MDVQSGESPIAQAIAQALVEGFNKHYRIFRETSRRAKELYEAALWQKQLDAVRERVQFYDDRVDETVQRLHDEFDADSLDDSTWQQVKLQFIGMLINHRQPELAETFFNSVTTKILHRSYFNNDYLFARPAISTEYIESYPPVYSSYYPRDRGLRATVRRIVEDFDWQRSFEDLDRDVDFVLRAARAHLGEWPAMEVNCQIQVLYSAFYRNKTAYIIGKTVNGYQESPFAIAVRHNERGLLHLDALILDPWRISVLFSLSRAYFLVDMEVPSGYVQFLRSIMPNKPRSELYTMLGLGKQGKTMFFRDLVSHLRHSNDQFIIAPGIRGLVMLVFTLPSFPYVFKIIKDVFGASKNMDRATVKRKYLMVKHVDRVGRMADTLEFSYAALPLARFHPELLEELRTLAPSSFEIDGDKVIIKHLYIERRMIPLNLHLEKASEPELEEAVKEYGNAIRELAIANIFPGDMLWKNFGVTRYGRVVFYDYDEIEYMTDMNFRKIPPAPYEEMEMSGEPWYSAGPMDVFPEEFATFLLGVPRVRKAFLKHHRDLLAPKFWQEAQRRIREGYVEDFFPYPVELRFCKLFPPAAGAASS
ncbi:bifunctional isocitrate dehydrogenase kinase/phosphatase [Thauera aminoaromatica]|jgi:isocitrate dehydrogenase kinase/phosphatase|uniref:Isocitrate dehydrogenase kinase/phosphatase n=3 Tax=Thauera aminoaromatica TaxID=164330 RepID=C4ZLW4_THASP|nr:bifunctional isocitrate dehydrogenase kinase/phosphatase [Thauera aminoaromatica]MBL8462891.1 bifunctional isocitrate dehydrogenase kinase/phosphatase [Thauera sp.]MDA0234765.1 bifunctional isocitrate dehydrogenase kinase/phosphatase [Pseudomonadota bacterium]OPZ06661.1 MAG: Isocitrate dehydrogenase kinase/phosphatase [Alphaproteobacteria bacterium ADurb.BinA305]ACK54019.1 (Isocitrate dehydrogenase (NADP(+))) kinase [Thauera aminoaromatica]ENO84951.1 bifunctional isocitrate dehydrogenase ki